MVNVSQWSTAAASNNQTPPAGWPEGMARSAVNDTARETHAAVARWYQDFNGSLVSAGTSSAFTLATNSVHTAFADLSPIMFRPHLSAVGGATLNVDTLGAKRLLYPGGADAAQAIVANSLVTVVYNATDDVFIVVSSRDDAIGDVGVTVSSAAPPGWLLLNGDTLGSGSSAATHNGAEFEALYTVFWDSMADAEAPVSGGRGVSAAADFAANKTLTMSLARGRSIIGTGSGAGLTARVHGSTLGVEDAIVVTHNHAAGTLAAASGGAHAHDVAIRDGATGGSTFVSGTDAGGSNTVSGAALSAGAHTHTISGSTANAGSSGTDANMMPAIALNIIVKF